MSLDLAILGFLNEKPLTGYDLKNKHFDLCVSHFWNADQAQIYKTLDKLVLNEFLSFEILYQDNKPNKKIYSITDKGKKKLVSLLEEEVNNTTIRDPFLVKIFFSSNIDNKKILELFEKKKEKHKKNLEYYFELEKDYAKEKDNRKKVLESLTLDLGMKYEKYHIEWCDESIEKIKSIKSNK